MEFLPFAKGTDMEIEKKEALFKPKKREQTFPAPTGPITARSCSGFTVKDTFCKVGVLSICKKKQMTVTW